MVTLTCTPPPTRSRNTWFRAGSMCSCKMVVIRKRKGEKKNPEPRRSVQAVCVNSWERVLFRFSPCFPLKQRRIKVLTRPGGSPLVLALPYPALRAQKGKLPGQCEPVPFSFSRPPSAADAFKIFLPNARITFCAEPRRIRSSEQKNKYASTCVYQ